MHHHPISSTFTTPFQQPNCHIQGHLLHTGIHQSTSCRSIHSSLQVHHHRHHSSPKLSVQTTLTDKLLPSTSQDQQQTSTSTSLPLSLHTVPGPPSHTTPYFTRFGQSVHSAAYETSRMQIAHLAAHWRGSTVATSTAA